MGDYRTKIYERYTVHTSVSGQRPDRYSYKQWASATKWYLRGWLPEDKNTPILDVGCGAGYFLWLAQESGYANLSGVDLSAEQVAMARQACPAARIVLGDVRQVLAQSPNQYGLITGFDLIEHLNKNELLEFLELVKGALIPGGRVVFQTPNPESPWGMKVRYGDFTHELAISPMGLRSLLALHGLGDFQARECGPYPHGIVSLLRRLLWLGLRGFMSAWNLIETGNLGSGVFTRVYVATARRPLDLAPENH